MADSATVNNVMQVLAAKANEQLKLTRFFRYNAQAKHGVPQDGVDTIKYERTETVEQPSAPPQQPEPQPQPPQPIVTIPEKIEIVCPERPAPPTTQPVQPPQPQPPPAPPVSTQPVRPPFEIPNWMKFLLAMLPLLALLALILWMLWPQPGTPVTPVEPPPPVVTPQQAESALQYLEDTGYHLP